MTSSFGSGSMMTKNGSYQNNTIDVAMEYLSHDTVKIIGKIDMDKVTNIQK